MLIFIYNLLFPFLFLLYLPLLLLKLWRRGGFNRFFWEKFGIYTQTRKQQLAVLSKPVWIHAVSVGEVVAALSFLRRWQQRRPGQDYVLSTTTSTGHALALQKLPENVPVVYCPLDFQPFVSRAFNLLKPSRLIIFEVEVWPTLLGTAARRGVPAALVNGRMSDRSARGYARHKWFFAPVFRRFKTICVQSPEDAARLEPLVADHVPVHVCSTMKFDQLPDFDPDNRVALLDEVFGAGDKLFWTAGSTHPGEEELVLGIFQTAAEQFPQLKLILVPRHHERTPEVEALLRQQGFSYRLLRPGDSPPPAGPVSVLLVNTTGELMNFYATADIVFVGKSIAGNLGGHNIIEPAILGKAVLHGPHLENFRFVREIFRRADATIEVADAAEMKAALMELLSDADKRAALGRRARDVVEQERGAVDRTIDFIEAESKS